MKFWSSEAAAGGFLHRYGVLRPRLSGIVAERGGLRGVAAAAGEGVDEREGECAAV